MQTGVQRASERIPKHAKRFSEPDAHEKHGSGIWNDSVKSRNALESGRPFSLVSEHGLPEGEVSFYEVLIVWRKRTFVY
jgi:hypothetical protein